MVALLLSAVAIMPVFGAVTGTVVVDKAFVAPLGSTKITVTDADLNILTAATNTPSGTWASTGTTVFLSLEDSNGQTGANFAGGTSAGDEIAGTPVVVASTDSATLSDYAVGIFNRTTGRISVQFGGSSAPGVDTLTITYNLASKNTTAATVTSPSDSAGISVTLTETGADTGIFENSFTVTGSGATVSNDTTDAILAVPGQDVTVKYTDASPSVSTLTTLRVEDTEPVGSLISPADGSETTSLAPVLTVDFTDVDSTVDSGTIAFVIDAATAASDADVSASIVVGTPTVTAITNGFRAVVTLDASLLVDKTVNIRWHATIDDLAGNTGTTDASASTSGDQDYALTIDQQGPNFASATVTAGSWWDAGASTPAVETDVTKSSSTIIGIELPDALDLGGGTTFDLAETLSAGTVIAADFEVDSLKVFDGTTSSDVTPSAANVYAGAPNWIFLTVPQMAPDARPTVNLLSTSAGICDTAGNCTTTGAVAGSDAQAPTVTVTSDRDATGSLDDADATLTITTNEAGGVPVVTIVSATDASPIAQTVTLVGTNIYESKITPALGMHSIKVVVQDTSSNSTTVGGKTVTSSWPASGALTLYVDGNLPAPAVTANNVSAAGASVESSDPFFLTAAYAGEKAEYGLASDGTITNVAANVDTDLDIHNDVTVTVATLDGVSILGSLDTQDNNTFNFAISGIATGDHELEITATDEAGNENETGVIAFTVTARKAYSVAMNAGWNLISFPGNPVDGAIASVLPTTHPATDVLSYDDGVWSVASRAAGGTWEGTLTAVDGDHGYWVNSTSSQPVTSLLALTSVGSAATLPTIAVEAGWNLVSVIDLKQTKQGSAGDTQTGANYFTSVDWSVAYTYNSSTRTWTRVTPASGNVLNGQGVWAWASKSGTLIP
jgi:hypothetical protein